MTLNYPRIRRLLFAAVLVVLEVLPVSGAGIVIQKVVEPQSTLIRLGDIAKIKADNQQEAKRLAAIQLIPAPAPGRRRFLRMREIQDLLAAHGENMNSLDFSGELMVEIAPSVGIESTNKPSVDRRAVWAGTSTVSAASMNDVNPSAAAAQSKTPRLTDAQAKEAQNYVERAVLEHLDRQSGGKSDWKLDIGVQPTDLAKVLEAKTSLQCSGGVSPWTGRQRLVVAFSTERGPVRIRFEADVRLTRAVVVATQPIERGRIITAADVAIQQWENTPQETNRRSLAVSLDSVIGMEAAQSVREGDAVYSDDFRPQLLIKKGDEIAVFARGGGIQVRTVARARQDGARGELIGVETLEAKEPFEAVVVGPREAVVFTATTAAPQEKVAEQPFRRMRQK